MKKKEKKSRKHYIYIDLCSSSSRCSKLDGIHEGIGFVVLRHLVGKRHLCLESLHGVTFALMWSAAVEYSKSKSPVGWDSAKCRGRVVVLEGGWPKSMDLYF